MRERSPGENLSNLPLFEKAKVASSSYQDVLQAPLVAIQNCLQRGAVLLHVERQS